MSLAGRHLVLACLAAAAAGLGGCSKPYQPSAWRTHVPPAVRAMHDPLPPTSAGLDAARGNYGLYCAACHGDDGGGRRGRPSLRTPRVAGETDGEIFWILENGSRHHGMPAWRSLGDPALWQLVRYIRTLPPGKP